MSVQRGAYKLVIKNPEGVTVFTRIIVHDFTNKNSIKPRILAVLDEFKSTQHAKDLRGLFVANYQYRGHWETTHDDWHLFLENWTQDMDTAVCRGMLYGYPVIVVR